MGNSQRREIIASRVLIPKGFIRIPESENMTQSRGWKQCQILDMGEIIFQCQDAVLENLAKI